MTLDHEHMEIAEIHCLIVPIILGETTRNHSELIAFLMWRIPQIMSKAMIEFNEGERIPSGVIATPVEEPDDLVPHTRVFTEARVTAHTLTVRSGPDETFELIRYISKDDIVRVYEEKTGWSCINPIDQYWVSSFWITPL